jgi:hypothetical protein
MRIGLVLAIAIAGWGGPAFSAESTYQPLREADCPQVASDEVGGSFLCHGPDGTPFMITEGDARMSVTFGGVGPASRVPFQSFGGFNSLGEKIEWRMENGVPAATILRWLIDSAEGGPQGQVLVVSKVGEDNSPGCVAVYVDALANSNANDLAREAAERIVPNVDCEIHIPLYYGLRGKDAPEPMLSPRE